MRHASRAFGKWKAWAAEGRTAHRLASLRKHVAWSYDGLGTMVAGAAHVHAEQIEEARQAALSAAARRRNRPLNRLGRSFVGQVGPDRIVASHQRSSALS